jgi:hypothetical protein
VNDDEKRVFVTPEKLARWWHLPLEDAVAICGSGCRVTKTMALKWARGTGPIDKTFADCAAASGTPSKALHGWRERGLLKVRAIGTGRTSSLLIAPAELARALRKIAADRNGTVEVPETPAQARNRGEKDRLAAIEACGG